MGTTGWERHDRKRNDTTRTSIAGTVNVLYIFRSKQMKTNQDRKMFMGIGKFMLPIPLMISNRGLEKGVSGAKAKAGLLSEEERRVHYFVVKKMAVAREPITAELISEELGISLEKVEKIIDKLEGLKTFMYRSDGKGINWAYPLSLENTGHRMTVSTGEEFSAA
jgi:hypothetical protein